MPALWTVRDVVAQCDFVARNFFERGGGERNNQSLLAGLVARHGTTAGLTIFSDLHWINDPDAPVTIPVDGAFGKRQRALPPNPAVPGQLVGASDGEPDSEDDEALATWRSLGVPTRLGSHAWVVSPAKSAGGFAMMFGGLQVGSNTLNSYTRCSYERATSMYRA